MLIGDVFYFRGGRRLNSCDFGVTTTYAARASIGGLDLVEWQCTNGDPHDYRYFFDGIEIPSDDYRVKAALRGA